MILETADEEEIVSDELSEIKDVYYPHQYSCRPIFRKQKYCLFG